MLRSVSIAVKKQRILKTRIGTDKKFCGKLLLKKKFLEEFGQLNFPKFFQAQIVMEDCGPSGSNQVLQ